MAKSPTQPTAKVFMSGPSQAVRLPQAFRFDCATVSIRRDGNSLVLTPIPTTWNDFLGAGPGFTADVVEAIKDTSDLLPIEERTAFD